jgi:SAM-dependent methyltransferase
MFGLEQSLPAKKALELFQEKKINKVLELGSGLGRDTIFFAKNSIHVTALDYSSSGIEITKQKALKQNLTKNISTNIFDIRKKLPFKDNSIEACFSHMLYCMALTSNELKNLNNEICRVLKPNGINIYTVRNTHDGDYKKGIHRGEDLFENDGFIVHFFSENKIKSLLSGFKNMLIEEFDEGKFPRKLYLVVNEKL